MQADKKLLLRWCGWFFLWNVLLFWIIALNYLPAVFPLKMPILSHAGKNAVTVFIGLSYIGQFALLAFLLSMPLVLLSLVFSKRHFIFITSAIVATLAAASLVLDTVVYRLYRFHLYGIFINVVMGGLTGQYFGLTWEEYVFGTIVIVGILCLELLFAYGLWHCLIKKKYLQQVGRWVVISLGLCLFSSYSVIIYSAGQPLYFEFTDASRFLPFYSNILGALLPVKNGFNTLERISEQYIRQPRQPNFPLNYPRYPLQHAKLEHKLNLIIITIDTWRFDMLNSEVMPNLTAFAKKSRLFTQHFSGGNATGPGVFTLFYGLPATYWDAMESQHRGPLLMDELLKQHYQIGIFSSGTLKLPELNSTVFQAIKNLQLKAPGEKPNVRDLATTREFKQFIEKIGNKQQPFFSFLFYDSAHGYCEFNADSQPFKPSIKQCKRFDLTDQSDPIPYLNRYKNALRIIDEQFAQVIAILEKQHLLNNTVIVVTGDHGEEFNDNHLNYWGHAGNFTRYQVQTPLIIYWPGKKPAVFTHKTSHFDVAPTLMRQLLGCVSLFADYSVGKNLFDTSDRPYFILGSYMNYGIVENNRITTIFPTGDFSIEQLDGQHVPEAKLNLITMQKAFADMRRFYIE